MRQSGDKKLDLRSAWLIVAPIIATDIFLVRGRFSLRFARVLSGPVCLVVIWSLLSFHSLLLSATVAVGLLVLVFHVTATKLMAFIS